MQKYGTAAPRIGKVAPGRGIVGRAMSNRKPHKSSTKRDTSRSKGRY